MCGSVITIFPYSPSGNPIIDFNNGFNKSGRLAKTCLNTMSYRGGSTSGKLPLGRDAGLDIRLDFGWDTALVPTTRAFVTFFMLFST